jgi:hypothetical protein
VAIGNGASGLTSSANVTANSSGDVHVGRALDVHGSLDAFAPIIGHDYAQATGLQIQAYGGSTSQKLSGAVMVTSANYTLPTVIAGEQLLLVFQADTVAVFSGSSQRVDFRDELGKLQSIPSGGYRVDVAGSMNGWFGTSAFGFNFSRATSATLTGCDAGHARLVF